MKRQLLSVLVFGLIACSEPTVDVSSDEAMKRDQDDDPVHDRRRRGPTLSHLLPHSPEDAETLAAGEVGAQRASDADKSQGCERADALAAGVACSPALPVGVGTRRRKG